MSSPVRVAIAGASGRMGLALLEAAAQTEGVMLGASVLETAVVLAAQSALEIMVTVTVSPFMRVLDV